MGNFQISLLGIQHLAWLMGRRWQCTEEEWSVWKTQLLQLSSGKMSSDKVGLRKMRAQSWSTSTLQRCCPALRYLNCRSSLFILELPTQHAPSASPRSEVRPLVPSSAIRIQKENLLWDWSHSHIENDAWENKENKEIQKTGPSNTLQFYRKELSSHHFGEVRISLYISVRNKSQIASS